MKIFGIDFTSAPSRKKPITCAACDMQENLLSVNDCLKFPSFDEFDAFLHSDGPWVAALDFPFGQPAKLISTLGWPQTWEGYVQAVSSMGKTSFENTLIRYSASRSVGDKQHLRATDAQARARSPMMLHRVPVGKMFFQGATRLLASDVSVLPCRPARDNRIVVEGYPALVARKWIGKRSYKSDEQSKQTADKLLTRQYLVCKLRSHELLDNYGITLELPVEMADIFIQDPTGDSLDALLCAIQAAWTYSQRDHNFGIPPDCNKNEGWIADPLLRTCQLQE
jgi:Protein of unknown function (DUF429)